MTREEYLENHDASEGAEEEIRDPRCPICGSDECEVYAVRDGEIVGCECCLCRVNVADLPPGVNRVYCPECGNEDTASVYIRHKAVKALEIIGCEKCIREVERWRWEAKI